MITKEFIGALLIAAAIGGAAVFSFQQYINSGEKSPEKPVITVQSNTPIVIPENMAVESYITTNIASIAPEQPVLGGKWYVTSVAVDTSSKTANIEYEDGHIQGKAKVIYTFDGTVVTVVKTEKVS